MPKKIIIGVVGTMAAGKGTIAEYLKKNYNASVFRFSNILRALLERLHKPFTRENLQNVSTVLRGQFGEDVLAEVMAGDVQEATQDIIVVEGIRRMADITHLRTVPGFVLVGVDAPDATRYQRYVERNENPGDAEMTKDRWAERTSAEAEQQIPEVMQQASVIWDNSGPIEDLYAKVDAFMNDHGHHKS